MGSGRIRLVYLAALAAVFIGAAFFIIRGAASAAKPYTLGTTLPKMIADFGGAAKVLEIDVNREDEDNQYVDYLVIAADGQVHKRDYVLEQQVQPDGGIAFGHYIHSGVRPATAAEQAAANVALGQIPPDVVEGLFKRVAFPDADSEAKLDGGQWTLSSKALGKFGAQFVARYDGTGLRQTASNPLDRLQCIQQAHQDVTKILACERRFSH
jgi:hypothetical protein